MALSLFFILRLGENTYCYATKCIGESRYMCISRGRKGLAGVFDGSYAQILETFLLQGSLFVYMAKKKSGGACGNLALALVLDLPR